MDARKISILLPSAYRARQLGEALEALWYSTYRPLEVCLSLVEDDDTSLHWLRDMSSLSLDVRSVEEYQRGAVYAWNRLAHRATGDVLALWADDLRPQAGWLSEALAALDDMQGDGLVGFNDLVSNGADYAAHWLASRKFIVEHLGGVMYPPLYHSWWADREVTDIAQAVGRYRWARGAVVEHLNYTFGKSEFDRTYREAAAHYEADRQIYEQRKLLNFPLYWTTDENLGVLPAQPEPA